MKKIITLILVGALLVACKTDSKPEEKLLDGYIISGTAPGVYNGIRVFLSSTGERGNLVTENTAIVMNERFTFEGQVTNPEVLIITGNSIKGNIPIIVENKAISIEIDKDDLKKSKVTGTKANEDLIAYETKVKKATDRRKALGNQIRTTVNTEEKAKLSEEYAQLNKEFTKLPNDYIEKNPNSLYALVIINTMLNDRNIDPNNVANLYELLDTDLKKTKLGNDISTKLDAIKQRQAALNATEIGKIAPKFSAPSTDGKELALDDVLGEVTIIDFWAAWCGPCRRENPNVVRVYDKYHDKGLEIISVSLDGNTRQNDPKDAWLKAIEQDKLTWHHVSNLSYFNDPVAKAYNIKSIPATFILDKNGTIIAKNLRGDALEAKIAELLN
ncbi:MAG: TlpA disulfide reductase family protein [Psychroserpens sp.]|uniref:redoxin domain-containing protein n=1 Tax=Psychroserpens sp. TaxID=2020870 RepID=UPI003C77E233